MDVHLFTDNHATMESIASTKQVERRLLRNDVDFLKQKLEDNEIQCYRWIQDEFQIADILTKSKNVKIGLDEVLEKNKLEVVKTHKEDQVIYNDGEFVINGSMLRRKIIQKVTIPRRKKIKKE